MQSVVAGKELGLHCSQVTCDKHGVMPVSREHYCKVFLEQLLVDTGVLTKGKHFRCDACLEVDIRD